MSNPKRSYNFLRIKKGASLVSSRTRPFWEYRNRRGQIPTGPFVLLYPRFIAKLLKKSGTLHQIFILRDDN
ncbi:hypothetical protein Avbf_03890 [Armadillidium vulgare]|nr:hypothetical protein Avbf_03890 [Armadillidium vulgare]